MKNYTELEAMSSYELAEEMQGVLTKYFKACQEQDDVTNQADYDKVAKVIDETRKDLSLLCMFTQRVIANEDNTKERMEREDLYAKYANKYFKYGQDEVVFFNIGDRRSMMTFESVSCCGKPELQITSNCSYKKKEYGRTYSKEESGHTLHGTYFCDSLKEITEKEFEAFLDKKSFQETIESL